MRILITAGPTLEPIDAVRYIGNRSSGKMGAALAEAAIGAGHEVTLILGPVGVGMPATARRIDVETTQQMLDAVLSQFPSHDLLIMAAAVADFRPRKASAEKIARGSLTLELESTPDVVAQATAIKRPRQRVVGFGLESQDNLDRVAQKLADKKLDLIVYNPTGTIGSENVEATLLWPGGRIEKLPSRRKTEFADILLQRSVALFGA